MDLAMKLLMAVVLAAVASTALGTGVEGESEFGPFENTTHRCNFDCTKAVDLALIVDASGSIQDSGADNWDKVVDFIINIVDNFEIGAMHTHISLLTFSTLGRPRIWLDQYMDAASWKAELMKNKDMWYEGGHTNTYDGLLKMRTQIFSSEHGDRPQIPNVAIVITDGKSSHHKQPMYYKDPVPQAQLAEEAGISVFVVGVTNDVLVSELQAISKSPRKENETYWRAPKFENIMDVMQTLLMKTCVAVCTPKDIVCHKALDIAFVIDGSGSIQMEEEKYLNPPQNTNWWLVIGFVKNFIDKFNIGPDQVQIGIVTFSNMGITRVKLNEFNDSRSLKAATNDYHWFGDGRTNTWEGLHKMRTEVFTEANGDRPNAPNVAIVITDGKSSHKKLPHIFKDPVPEAKLARDADIMIYGVGVTNDVDYKELEAIASRPKRKEDDTVFGAEEFNKLTELLQFFLKDVVEQSCRYE